MKKSIPSIILTVIEYLVLIAPTTGYAIYCYEDTLQYTMTTTSKGTFWTLISLAILVAVIYGIFKKKYERYVDGFVQQKTDLETDPNNELLIKKVAEKKSIIETFDYIVALFPLMISITILHAFQTAIDQLVILLTIITGSILGKIACHLAAISLSKQAMLNKIKE